ncbi:MAG TPA: acyl-CoA dehydrogenase family protein [Deferrisomatales bacterium]|nr:acyl-CoA dehydrogenase family protein [Deferrisomatales bacterium]
MTNAAFKRGGSFLVDTLLPEEIFTPEDFDAEQKMYAKTAREFVEKDVLPRDAEIEAKELDVTVGLLKKSGELGLLMADIPEEYGGLGLDKASAALIVESLAGQGSYQVFHLVQTGIGSLPIVYYGTPEQKRRYLPGLADGSLLGCYGLTETAAGSDALAARTKAVLSADGSHYVLNGSKQFITSARVADVLIVFAKVDGERFTGFLVDKGTAGLSFGPDEHKMGIHGCTTSSIVFQDVQVPVGNVLGEIGQGHKIAFNILNIGRFKLGALAVGMCKRAIEHSLAYCLERKQFGQRLVAFGAIREKLGQMVVRAYAAESMAYRTVGLIDQLLAGAADKYGEAGLDSIEEYSVECSMVKVLGSEALDYVVDEMVQCYGGYGYCGEYPAEAYYRDSRINRIYEGTNEINRLVIATMLVRKATSGVLPLFEAAEDVGAPAEAETGVVGAEQAVVANLKKIALLVLGLAARKYGKGLGKEQSIVLRLADLVAAAYVAESTLLRTQKDLSRRGEAGAALPVAVTRITCEEAIDQAESLARQCLVAMGESGSLETLGALVKRTPADVVAAREVIAAKLVEMERLTI